MKSPIADIQYTGGDWKDGGFQRNFESRKKQHFCTDYAISILAFDHVLKFNWCRKENALSQSSNSIY